MSKRRSEFPCSTCGVEMTGDDYLSEPWICRRCRGFIEPLDCGICNHNQVAALGFVQPEEIYWCEAIFSYAGGSRRLGVARKCGVCDGAIDTSSGGRSPVHPYGIRLDGMWLEVCLPCVYRLKTEGVIDGTRPGHRTADWDWHTEDCNWFLDEDWLRLAKHYLDQHLSGDDALPVNGRRWMRPQQMELTFA